MSLWHYALISSGCTVFFVNFDSFKTEMEFCHKNEKHFLLWWDQARDQNPIEKTWHCHTFSCFNSHLSTVHFYHLATLCKWNDKHTLITFRRDKLMCGCCFFRGFLRFQWFLHWLCNHLLCWNTDRGNKYRPVAKHQSAAKHNS